MAEIRLQHKQRRVWWPWLLLILVALLGYLFWSRGHQGTATGSTAGTVSSDSTTSPSANGAAATGSADSTSGARSRGDAVADFRTFVAEQSAFRSAVDAMTTGAGASSAASLRRAADAITPNQHLLAQKTADPIVLPGGEPSAGRHGVRVGRSLHGASRTL